MTSSKSTPTARPSVHLSIDVPNLEAGLRFYGTVFGFREKARPFPTMAVLDANNLTICMHEKGAGTKPSPGGSDLRRYERHWTPVHVDVHVEDVDAALAKCSADARPDSWRLIEVGDFVSSNEVAATSEDVILLDALEPCRLERNRSLDEVLSHVNAEGPGNSLRRIADSAP
jgi:catechol 2,3-dioxygenase-like lactoylglutathione lyase family enzyme